MELGFFTNLGAAVKANAIKPAYEALFAQFERIGLTQDGFDPSKLCAPHRKGLIRALHDGPSVAISAFETAAARRDGWSWATAFDNFGFDYPLRALVTGPYFGGGARRRRCTRCRYGSISHARKILDGISIARGREGQMPSVPTRTVDGLTRVETRRTIIPINRSAAVVDRIAGRAVGARQRVTALA